LTGPSQNAPLLCETLVVGRHWGVAGSGAVSFSGGRLLLRSHRRNSRWPPFFRHLFARQADGRRV